MTKSEQTLNWRKNNPEKWKKIAKKAQIKYRRKYPEKIKRRQQEWLLKNPNYQQIYKKKNTEKVKKWKKEWSIKNPYKNLEYKSKRRFRKLNNGGFHTSGEWELLKKQYAHTCPCCHKSEPNIKLTEDHIIPLFKGGSDLIENIQPLCMKCNQKKYTKIIKFQR